MGKIKILFWFDVEDFINPESEAALVGILDLLDKRGIIGIFKFVGEKIRKLEEHHRTDIIERLKQHEIGYHTNFHSVHPVITEYLEPFGFKEGAEEFERREGSGFTDLQRIAEQPILCYGQPGLAWAPQSYPVLNKWNIPVYLDGHDQVTLGNKPFWYGGLLNMTSLVGLMYIPLEEGALEAAIERFDQLCELQQDEEIGFISIFYHPTEFVFAEFWDAVNFAKGSNPPRSEWVKPPFRPEGDMQRYLDRVGEFVDYTLTKENVEYIGAADLIKLEKTEERVLSQGEVVAFAEQIGSELSYCSNGNLSLSAAELFWVFRQYLLGDEPIPVMVYGPECDASNDQQSDVRVEDVLAAIKAPLPTVCGFKQLPDYYVVAGSRINPASLACMMAAIIRDRLGENEEVQLINGSLQAADHASGDGHWAKHWIIFPEDLQIPNIVAMSKLQAWTLKPALF